MPFTPQDHDEYLRSYDQLLGRCIGFTRNRVIAEDICQTAFLNAWTHQDQFKPGTNMIAWLYRIARNAYHDETRRPSARFVLAAGDGNDLEKLADYNPYEPVMLPQEAHVDLEKTRAALATLRGPLRRALTAMAEGTLSKRVEMESALSDTTIRVRAHKARAQLRQTLRM